MIQVTGPRKGNWDTLTRLRAALAEVPESGRFQFGVSHCNKLQQLQRMEAADVRCVPFTTDFELVYEAVFQTHAEVLAGYGPQIWLGRKIHHTQGRDILLPDRKFWRTRDYWTKYIPSTAEWRIHVFDGNSIARGMKVFHGDQQEPTEFVIRSRARDYVMTHNVDPPRGVRQLAKAAVQAIGETFGAVDILIGQDGFQYVLEVNTAPAMDNYTLRAYVKAIRRRFQK